MQLKNGVHLISYYGHLQQYFGNVYVLYITQRPTTRHYSIYIQYYISF